MGGPGAARASAAPLPEGRRLSFFAHIGGEVPQHDPPRRVYAWIDASSETADDGLTRLDCVDADWADDAELSSGLLADPTLSVEAERRISMILLRHNTSGEQEGQILELTLDERSGRRGASALHFLNLTGPGLPRSAEIRWPDPEEAARIARITAFGEEDASDDEIVDALRRVPRQLDAVAVYDVGQGACSALIANDHPQLYFDVGGGSLGDSATFPANFTGLCTGVRQPIVLSHWHFDHWALAKRFGDALLQTSWIVPRQSSFRPSSATLLGLIRRNGRALIRTPNGAVLRVGSLSLHDCTGRGINNSGLAMVVWGPGDEAIVLPGDARYRDIAGLPAEVLSLVAAHHGGRTGAGVREIPLPTGGATGRLVYSCGSKNSYNHPLEKSVDDHNVAWGGVPQLRTSERAQGNPAEHVHLYFDDGCGDVGLVCRGSECSLSASRR